MRGWRRGWKENGRGEGDEVSLWMDGLKIVYSVT